MPKMEEDFRNYADMNTLLNLYQRIYEMPYTYENQNSMQDLCFLMNQISVPCGDYSFCLYYSGPFSYELDNQISRFFNPDKPIKEIRRVDFDVRTNSGIESLKLLKNSIIKSSFNSREIEQKRDVIYFMNAVAIANYLINYTNHEIKGDLLDTLNIMREKKDVNEIAVHEAKKLKIIN